MNYVNPFTGTHKAGNHEFRRFRNTYLRNYVECPGGLYKFWMGHAGKDMSDLYDKIKQDQRGRAVPQKMGQSSADSGLSCTRGTECTENCRKSRSNKSGVDN